MTRPADAEVDAEQLRTWIGRTESRREQACEAPVAGLAATLDVAGVPCGAGAAIPPLWHWVYFTPRTPRSEIGPDGHAKRGGFLPPVPLPRRMWAGGRLEFRAPLRVGDAIERVSRIENVTVKSGRSGPLVFVAVRHEISGAAGVAVTEEHDIVYRDLPKAGDAAPPPVSAPSGAAWEREIVPDDVLLFRYSALTFNGHRIHYDRRYVTEVEGYPGLIVHGPLIATLLVGLVGEHRPEARVTRFEFRAVRPLFDIAPFHVCGEPEGARVKLWARDAQGCLAMEASAGLA